MKKIFKAFILSLFLSLPLYAQAPFPGQMPYGTPPAFFQQQSPQQFPPRQFYSPWGQASPSPFSPGMRASAFSPYGRNPYGNILDLLKPGKFHEGLMRMIEERVLALPDAVRFLKDQNIGIMVLSDTEAYAAIQEIVVSDEAMRWTHWSEQALQYYLDQNLLGQAHAARARLLWQTRPWDAYSNGYANPHYAPNPYSNAPVLQGRRSGGFDPWSWLNGPVSP